MLPVCYVFLIFSLEGMRITRICMEKSLFDSANTGFSQSPQNNNKILNIEYLYEVHINYLLYILKFDRNK